jgi:uncharacterized RDD family membrane protein YckC
MAMHSGWYEDPHNPDQLRYWDGILWTNRTTPKVSPTAQQSTIGQAPPVPGQAPRIPGQAPPAPGHPPAPGPGYGQPSGYVPQQWQSTPWAQAGPTAPDGTPVAAWWQRLVAWFIDRVVTSVLSLIFAWPWVTDILDAFRRLVSWAAANPQADQSAIDVQARAFADQIGGVVVPYVLIAIAIQLVYQVGFVAAAGATPGKFLLGTRVRRMDRPGPPGLVAALRRQLIWLGTVVLGFIPIFGIVALVVGPVDSAWLLWDGRRQCLHDKVAGTVVVKKL